MSGRVSEYGKGARPFDLLFADYDAWYEREPGKSIFTIEAYALKQALHRKPESCLEVGVGTGRFAKKLSVQFGVDAAFKPLYIARKRGALCVQGVGEHLPFRGNTFDVSLMVVTLCFVSNPQKVIREVFRILRPGGQIVIGMVLRESPWGKTYAKKAKEGHPFYTIASFYSCEEIIRWLKLSGFTDIGILSTLFQPPGKPNYKFEMPREGYEISAGFTVFNAKKAGD